MAQQDASEAVDALLAAQVPQLLALARALTHDRHAAEDLVQDALVDALRHRSRVNQAMNQGAYLRRIVINRFLADKRKRSAPSVALTGNENASVTQGIDGPVATSLSLRQAIRGLTPATRAAVVLKFLLDLNIAEVAAAMGIQESTARANLSRGIAELRKAWSDDSVVREGRQ